MVPKPEAMAYQRSGTASATDAVALLIGTHLLIEGLVGSERYHGQGRARSPLLRRHSMAITDRCMDLDCDGRRKPLPETRGTALAKWTTANAHRRKVSVLQYNSLRLQNHFFNRARSPFYLHTCFFIGDERNPRGQELRGSRYFRFHCYPESCLIPT